MPDEALDYGDHRGRIELRETLAAYLGRVRGVRVDPVRMVITQGFSQSLDLLCRTLAARGARHDRGGDAVTRRTLWETIEVERPASWSACRWTTTGRASMSWTGCRRTPSSSRRPTSSRAARSWPPSGGSRSSPGRGHATASLIEDDYDAENRYDRLPIGALQGLDPSHVAHAGTASKTLAPGLRIGWLSLPGELVGPITAMKNLADSGSPSIDQFALATLIEQRRLRAPPGARPGRSIGPDAIASMAAVARELPGLEPARRGGGGPCGPAAARRGRRRGRAPTAAAAIGIYVVPLSTSYVPGADRGTTPSRGLLLGYSRLPRAAASTRPWPSWRGLDPRRQLPTTGRN